MFLREVISSSHSVGDHCGGNLEELGNVDDNTEKYDWQQKQDETDWELGGGVLLSVAVLVWLAHCGVPGVRGRNRMKE